MRASEGGKIVENNNVQQSTTKYNRYMCMKRYLHHYAEKGNVKNAPQPM